MHAATRKATPAAAFASGWWTGAVPLCGRRYDCILAADVIYEARSFAPLTALLQRYLARGGVAAIAEPGRVNAAPFFSRLKERGFVYRRFTQRVQWDGGHRVSIYVVRHKAGGNHPRR